MASVATSAAVPRLAVVGHPNKGKSSLVATLAHDDSVAISPHPGTTLAAREYPMRVDGVHRPLTSYQYELVLAMAERAGRVLSRETLFDLVKGESIEAFDRSIDVHISRIRSAIEDNPKRPRRVLTVRGAGYVFAKAQD